MEIILTADRSRLAVPHHPSLEALVPHGRRFLHPDGRDLFVMPNGLDEIRLARNLDLDIPPPILTRYEWGGRVPWDVQRTTAAMLVDNARAYILSSMGTGKTLSSLFAFDFLRGMGRVKRMLVAAPLSTLTPVWEAEVWGKLPHLKAVVLHGTRAQRMQRLASDADVYVINHHGISMMWKELKARGFDIVVIDELSTFKNKSTLLWRTMNALIETTPFVWGLTGSPTPMAPTDAYAQARLITPNRVPKTFGAFRDATMHQVSQHRWVPRREANDVVFAALQPALRYSRDDIMELPPTTYVDRAVALSPLAEEAYRTLVQRMRMMTNDGRNVTAVNEGVLAGKLLQVSLGWVYTDTKHVYQLPNKERLDALEEVVSENDRKTLVFVPYVHAIAGVAAHLRGLGYDVAEIHGGVPKHARDRIFVNFQNRATPRIIVAHPATMSHGLTLTEASVVMWFGPPPSFLLYEQANARITRPGQTTKTLIVHLIASPAEKVAYRRTRARESMQGSLLEMFSHQTQENT